MVIWIRRPGTPSGPAGEVGSGEFNRVRVDAVDLGSEHLGIELFLEHPPDPPVQGLDKIILHL